MSERIAAQTTRPYRTASLDLAAALVASGFRVVGVEPTGNNHVLFVLDATPDDVRWAILEYDGGTLLVNAKRLLVHRGRLKGLALDVTGRSGRRPVAGHGVSLNGVTAGVTGKVAR